MDSDRHLLQPNQQQQQIVSSGLTRYRSAPSSYFSNLINSGTYGEEDCDIFSRFMSTTDNSNPNSQNLCQIGGNESQFVDSSPLKHEQEDHIDSQQQQQMMYRSETRPSHLNSVAASTSAMDDSLMVATSMGMDRLPQMKNSNLIRQSSTPAGFLSHINIDNGLSVMRAMESFGAGRGTGTDSSFSSAKRLRNQMNFSSGPPSSSGLLNPIPEKGSKIMGMSSPPGDGSFGATHSKDDSFVACFQSGSWDDSSILSDNFLKELADSDRDTFSSLTSENQKDEGRNRNPTPLTHQMSLPTSSAELSAMEKLFQFQDSVPLKIRAKRGCATHPRSIAERVRRTRISERMRKLQELVPNMDKQTNTADMLDLAVDYIKDLQKKVETLSETRAKCTCSK